jgi:NAD-dependent dihydropyrimidine dehydrogenase PreA subunit
MKRMIIHIDEKKCTGCGACVPNCPEGALKIVNGKAKLASEILCDGLGACVGKCPFGAMRVEEREAAEYDERKVMQNIVKQDEVVIQEHLTHLKEHGQAGYFQEAVAFLKEKKKDVPLPSAPAHGHAGGCPGTRMVEFKKAAGYSSAEPSGALHSMLEQWPVQLHLLNPRAPYFKNADLLVAADCVPFAYADFHRKFLKGKKLIILCPKLDNAHQEYVEKLTEIIKANVIKSITMVHMEVPCCSGVNSLVEEAVQKSGKNVILKDYTVSLQGELI